MSTEQLNNIENTSEEVKDIVTENVPETAESVEKVEEVVAAADEKKTKSFFEIFKKEKTPEQEDEAVPVEAATEAPVEAAAEAPVEAAAEAPVEADAEAPVEADAEAPAAAETLAEEVPVDSATAKKSRYCGLCALGKKSEEVAPAEDAAATEESSPVDAEEAAPVADAEEAAPAAEEATPVAEEATAAPVAEEAVAAETTEGEGETVAPIVEADIARSGVLFKSGKFFKSNMNERHCRLLTSGAFQWSKTEDFTKAHECSITTESTTVAFMAEGEETAHKYRFELHCCGSVTTYAVDTEEDRDEWIRAIETVKESIVVPVAEEGGRNFCHC